MFKKKKTEELTEVIRNSAFETKAKKQKEKNCLRDYTGYVFELTSEMLVKERSFESNDKNDLAGVAECILRKYEKLLGVK
jgi:hypothetical protein